MSKLYIISSMIAVVLCVFFLSNAFVTPKYEFYPDKDGKPSYRCNCMTGAVECRSDYFGTWNRF